MVFVKWLLAASLVLALLACRDPYSFEPGDPTKPDPPAPPQLVAPADSWRSDSYAYPQNVSFGWQAVPSAQFYEMQIQTDSLFPSPSMSQHLYGTATVYSIQRFGLYYWRVRAASRDWNDYTDWSPTFRFSLPNPAD